MKILKFIGKTILNLILTGCIFLLMFSFYSKMVFSDFLSNILIKSYTTTEVSYKEVENDSLNDIYNSSTYEDLLKDEKVKELINQFIDMGLSDIVSEEGSSNESITQDIIDFLKENKGLLEEKYGITISDEDIDSLSNNDEFKNLDNQYKETIKVTKTQISDEYKKIIKTYNFFVGITFKIILVIIMIIDLIIIAITQKSFYKWIKVLGGNLISSGIMTIIMGILLFIFMNNYFNKMNLDYSFNVYYILNTGIGALGVGCILLIIYFIINKLLSKKKVEDLYNEVSSYVE